MPLESETRRIASWSGSADRNPAAISTSFGPLFSERTTLCTVTGGSNFRDEATSLPFLAK